MVVACTSGDWWGLSKGSHNCSHYRSCQAERMAERQARLLMLVSADRAHDPLTYTGVLHSMSVQLMSISSLLHASNTDHRQACKRRSICPVACMGTSVSIPMKKDVSNLNKVTVPMHSCCFVMDLPLLLRYYLCTQKPLQQDIVHTAVLLGFLFSGKVVLLPVLGQTREVGSWLELELIKVLKSVGPGSNFRKPRCLSV